jgi:hypothetical protein
VEVSSELVGSMLARFPALLWSTTVLEALCDTLEAGQAAADASAGSSSAAYLWLKKASGASLP